MTRPPTGRHSNAAFDPARRMAMTRVKTARVRTTGFLGCRAARMTKMEMTK